MLQGRLRPALTVVAILVGVFLKSEVAVADMAATELAAVSGAAGRLARLTSLPAILSDADLAAYRQAFEHQRLGQWSAADRDISHLENPILVGHLLAARYLTPGYRASGEELAGWMARYADLPQATQIFTLAKSRLGTRGAALKPPARAALSSVPSLPAYLDELGQWDEGLVEPPHGMAVADRRKWQVLRDRIRWSIHHDQQDKAAAMLDSDDSKRLFTALDIDHLKTNLAMSYFANGSVDQARRLAEEACDRSGDQLAEAHWVAGLAAWRNGDRAASAHHFEVVANAPGKSSWTVAAGAFWAARANLAAHKPQVVNHWLQQAAGYPRTFYGLLARRALGQDIEYSWESHPFTEADAEVLRSVPAAQRALALIQLGDRELAEDELHQVLPSAGPAMARSLLAVANDGNLPGAAVQASSALAERDGKLRDAGDYPLPNWKPNSGWQIDRALMLAIAKQESGFNPHARNPSGALGLMQLMPATVRTLGSAGRLTDPEVNLDLGQKYVHRLLDADGVKGNLLALAAAYNVGPGTVSRWMQSIKPGDDALLFLESMPFRETRSLVEHVMTNFWAYRNRFGQSSPSLDAVAAGRWPMYDAPELKARMPPDAQN
jgi:soluble lytic murein transglycosylase-like protein